MPHAEDAIRHLWDETAKRLDGLDWNRYQARTVTYGSGALVNLALIRAAAAASRGVGLQPGVRGRTGFRYRPTQPSRCLLTQGDLAGGTG